MPSDIPDSTLLFYLIFLLISIDFYRFQLFCSPDFMASAATATASARAPGAGPRLGGLGRGDLDRRALGSDPPRGESHGVTARLGR
jgi:hypothetical protein